MSDKEGYEDEEKNALTVFESHLSSSNIKARDGLSIVSNKEINIVSSNIDSISGEILLNGKDGVNILAIQENKTISTFALDIDVGKEEGDGIGLEYLKLYYGLIDNYGGAGEKEWDSEDMVRYSTIDVHRENERYDHFGLQDNVNLYKKFLTDGSLVALAFEENRGANNKRILEGFQGLLGDFNLSVKTNEPGEYTQTINSTWKGSQIGNASSKTIIETKGEFLNFGSSLDGEVDTSGINRRVLVEDAQDTRKAI